MKMGYERYNVDSVIWHENNIGNYVIAGGTPNDHRTDAYFCKTLEQLLTDPKYDKDILVSKDKSEITQIKNGEVIATDFRYVAGKEWYEDVIYVSDKAYRLAYGTYQLYKVDSEGGGYYCYQTIEEAIDDWKARLNSLHRNFDDWKDDKDAIISTVNVCMLKYTDVGLEELKNDLNALLPTVTKGTALYDILCEVKKRTECTLNGNTLLTQQ